MDTIVGIDLGTTNSEIAVCTEDGRIEVIPVDGEPIMPSCVGLDPAGNVLVGRTARNQMVSHPEQTILSIKRRMGEATTVELGGKALLPQEVSALILGKLKDAAQEYLGQTITKAVITVPAYFDEAQRAATRDAGTLAGLQVARIINEPTAAALAYEASHAGNQRILVYDLGGGTFDASLVVVEHGVVEVKASHGDTHLGGDDFDRLLIDHVVCRFVDQHGFDPTAGDLRAANRLWVAAEKAKRVLSDRPFAVIREEFITGDLHLNMEIGREEYEELIRPLLTKTMDAVHACLTDARLLPRDLDKIILVGGTTRTPLVARMLAADTGLEPQHAISPDLIVAMGAALQGATLAGRKTRSILVDITPYTFGTRAVDERDGIPSDDVFVPVIRRNSPLPVSKEEVFYTMFDNQRQINVEIYQGEDPVATRNIFVGEFLVEGLSKAKAGNPILLAMTLDVNGMLKVTAREKITGLSRTVTMDTTKAGARAAGQKLREIEALLSELTGDESTLDKGEAGEAQLAAPREVPEAADRQKDGLLARAQTLRKRAEAIQDRVGEEDAVEITRLLEESRQAISGGDWESVGRLNESLADMLFYLED